MSTIPSTFNNTVAIGDNKCVGGIDDKDRAVLETIGDNKGVGGIDDKARGETIKVQEV